ERCLAAVETLNGLRNFQPLQAFCEESIVLVSHSNRGPRGMDSRTGVVRHEGNVGSVGAHALGTLEEMLQHFVEGGFLGLARTVAPLLAITFEWWWRLGHDFEIVNDYRHGVLSGNEFLLLHRIQVH